MEEDDFQYQQRNQMNEPMAAKYGNDEKQKLCNVNVKMVMHRSTARIFV
jgi:hypothetical protein